VRVGIAREREGGLEEALISKGKWMCPFFLMVRIRATQAWMTAKGHLWPT